MKNKLVLRIWLDVLMTAVLLFLMGWQFWGEAAHEWAGAAMFIMFIAHHFLNRNWHKRLFRGRYSPQRILTLCINILLVLAMLSQMLSGIMISRSVFGFLNINVGAAFARRLHILGAYWGYILMSLHLGLHWSGIMSAAAKPLRLKPSKIRKTVNLILGGMIAAYGVYAFVSRGFPAYLFLKSEFVFMNYDESKILFYLDYLALMGLFVFLGHYGGRACRRFNRKREAKR